MSMSVSPSLSMSLTITDSPYPTPTMSMSVSPTMSMSVSPSMSISLSPSITTSISPSISPSITITTTIIQSYQEYQFWISQTGSWNNIFSSKFEVYNEDGMEVDYDDTDQYFTKNSKGYPYPRPTNANDNYTTNHPSNQDFRHYTSKEDFPQSFIISADLYTDQYGGYLIKGSESNAALVTQVNKAIHRQMTNSEHNINWTESNITAQLTYLQDNNLSSTEETFVHIFSIFTKPQFDMFRMYSSNSFPTGPKFQIRNKYGYRYTNREAGLADDYIFEPTHVNGTLNYIEFKIGDLEIFPTPSMSVSITPSMSVSITPSMSVSITPSMSVSITSSMSPSITPSISQSITSSLSPTMSMSLSPSLSMSLTITDSPYPTPSITPSISQSITSSLSPTMSMSLSPSLSMSLTITDSPYPTPTISMSVSPTMSMSVSPSMSMSLSPSLSMTITETDSPYPTPTMSISITETDSPYPTPTMSISITESTSMSLSPTITSSLSQTITSSLSPSMTMSLTPSVSMTISPSLSPSITDSPYPTQSMSLSITDSPYPTPSMSMSLSISPTPSQIAVIQEYRFYVKSDVDIFACEFRVIDKNNSSIVSSSGSYNISTSNAVTSEDAAGDYRLKLRLKGTVNVDGTGYLLKNETTNMGNGKDKKMMDDIIDPSDNIKWPKDMIDQTYPVHIFSVYTYPPKEIQIHTEDKPIFGETITWEMETTGGVKINEDTTGKYFEENDSIRFVI